MNQEKSKAEQLQDELFFKPKHAMRGDLTDAEIERADQFCEDYKAFLNASRTRRILLPQGGVARICAL